MSDPMYSNLPAIVGGELSPAEIRAHVGDNLYVDRRAGWSSDNLALAAWLCELVASVAENNAARIETLRDLVRRRMELELGGEWGGIECFGRVYALWNYMARLGLYRVAAHLPGWEAEAAQLRLWLRCWLGAAALASGDGAGREITDHKTVQGENDVPVPIYGDGEPVDWYAPYVAWSGDRGCQRTRDASEYGYWQHLTGNGHAAPLVQALDIPARIRRETWIEFWPFLEALDRCWPVPAAPLGLTVEEAFFARMARRNDVEGLRTVCEWLLRPSVPLRIVRASEGVWTLSPVARGSSTAHLDVCAWWTDGRCGWLCGDPGWRESGGMGYVRSGRAGVDVQPDGSLLAWAERDGRQERPTMALPGGTVYLDVLLSPDGVVLTTPPRGGLPDPGSGPTVPATTPPTAPGTGSPGAPRKSRPNVAGIGIFLVAGAAIAKGVGSWFAKRKARKAVARTP